MIKHKRLKTACVLALLFFTGMGNAQELSHDNVKVGVLEDMSGIYSELSGSGSVVAAQMAIDDLGGTVLGKPIKLVSGDFQNKADVASSIARRWIDRDNVDMIVGLTNSAVAVAVQGLASSKDTITMSTGPGTTALTEGQCSKYGIHYVYDTYALPVGTATAMVKNGGKTWFFITADYEFGHSLQQNTTNVVEKLGGKVVGGVAPAIGTKDFASYLVQAQTSGADVIALATSGEDLVNTIKQANEFGITKGNQKMASLLMFLTVVKSLGLETAQGLNFTTAFYWDRTRESRKWSQRFFEKHGAMPTMAQAGVYSAVSTYLQAVKAAGTDEANAVRRQLGKMTVNDMFARDGKILPNGLMKHDMYLAKVKSPGESKGPWDLAKIVTTIPADNAFIPLSQSSCPLLKR